MKIPTITPEAMDEAAAEPVRPGSIYEWLEREQPHLFKWAHLQKDGEDEDLFFDLRANILVGVAFTLRSLANMPETPPDSSETSQDELRGWQAAIDSVRASLRGYPDCGGDIEIMKEVDRIAKDHAQTLQDRSGKPIGTTHGLLAQDKLKRIWDICDHKLKTAPHHPYPGLYEIKRICEEE